MLLCLFVKSMMMMRMSGRESIKGGTWRRQRLSIVVWKKIHLLPQLHKTPKIIPGMRSHLSIHALPSNSTYFHLYFYLLSICQHTKRKDIAGQPLMVALVAEGGWPDSDAILGQSAWASVSQHPKDRRDQSCKMSRI